MAIQNKGQIGTAVTSLISAIATSFPNNTTKLITPAILRAWLTSLTAILTSVNDSENNVGEIYTKAALETKRAAGGLTPNQFYFISNATGAGTKVIAILASAANAFHTSAINLTDGSFGAYVLGTDVFTAVGGGGGIVQAIVAGANITVNNADPGNPIVSSVGLVPTGQNSITLQSVNTGNPIVDALTNGANLLAALTAVNALDWGIRSDRNRGCLLLMPGTYNTDSTTIQMFPFIDIVGLSTDRKATIIMGSGMAGDQRHIDFNTSNAGLHNLTLIANVANNAIMLGGDAGCFPICENVYFGSNNIFTGGGGGSNAGFFDLDGRFNNCEFKSGFTYSFYADSNITATISNSIIYGVVSCVSFTGKLINCDINTVGIIDHSVRKIATGAVIERCNIVSDSGVPQLTLFSVSPASISCSFSTFNNVWDPAITNSLSTIPALDKMGLRDGQNVLIGVPAYGSSARGTTTFAAVLATTTYTITHGLPLAPLLVTIQSQNSSAASAMSYVSNITATTFDITFLAVPTGTPQFGFVAYN